MKKKQRTYAGMRPVFIKHFLRGSVKCLPVLGKLLDEITFGVLDEVSAKTESARLHVRVDEIIKEHDQQEYDFAEILAGLHIQSDVNEEIKARLKEIELSLRDDTDSPFPEYFGKAIEKIINENKEIFNGIQKLITDHDKQERAHQRHDKKLDKIDEKLDDLSPVVKRRQDDSPIQNLPYESIGGLFKGRGESLAKLVKQLGRGKVTAITQTHAIHGLGGIGKTRMVVEFGWRLLEEGKVKAVLFVVADNLVNFTLNMAELAGTGLLNLDERKLKDQLAVVEAVVAHLAGRDDYLVIFDNVDDEEARKRISEIVPRLCRGRVIITSRMTEWSRGVKALAIDKLSEEEAVSYLLEKTQEGRAAAEDDEKIVHRLAEKLDGLPIALEQAAAYINHRHVGFKEYLAEFDKGRKKVLSWHKDKLQDHPQAVLSVWQTTEDCLEDGERAILRLASFLAPEAIPARLFESQGEKIAQAIGLIGGGKEEVGEIDVRGMLSELSAWSMINLTGERFFVHRLVQESVRLRIEEEDYKKWTELALWLVDDYIPDDPQPHDVRSWGLWEVMAPHVSIVAEYGDRSGIAEPTGRLMNELALHFDSKASFEVAEKLYRRALAIYEKTSGPEHTNTVVCLNNLAQLLQDTNRLDEAEPLMRRVLEIDEASFGPEHPNVAIDLSNLAQLLQDTNRLDESEPLMRRALEIGETSLGPEHPNVAIRLNNLALLLQDTNRLDEAEPLMRRALEIDEASFGPEHPNVAGDLNNMAELLRATNRLDEAEPLYRRALKIDEESFGPEHPNVARDLNNLAGLLQAMNRLDEAEPLYRRALEIDETSFGTEHPNVATCLNNLARLLQDTNRLDEAEPLMERHLVIFLEFTRRTGHPHPHLEDAINNYGGLLMKMGHSRNEVIERLKRLAPEMFESADKQVNAKEVIFREGATDMGDKGKKDKGKREKQKKGQLSPKDKRKSKKPKQE